MSQIIILTAAAALLGAITKWARLNHSSAAPELMAAKVKRAPASFWVLNRDPLQRD